MPNQYQWTFLLAFVGGLSSLLVLEYFFVTKLSAAGYDISRLILIGLPSKDAVKEEHTNMATSSVAGIPYPQVLALVFAVATSALLYVKFGAKSTLCGMSCSAAVLTMSPERTPVLDPKEWKEFPLKEKIIISPNTAMSVVITVTYLHCAVLNPCLQLPLCSP
jgi:cytochrome-b5 reductase